MGKTATFDLLGRADHLLAELHLVDAVSLTDVGREALRRKAADLIRSGFDLLESTGVDSWRWDDCLAHVVALVSVYGEPARKEIIKGLLDLISGTNPPRVDLSSVIMSVMDDYDVSASMPALALVRYLRTQDEGEVFYAENGVELGRFDATDIGEPEDINGAWGPQGADGPREITTNELAETLAFVSTAPGFNNRAAFQVVVAELKKIQASITIIGRGEDLRVTVDPLYTTNKEHVITVPVDILKDGMADLTAAVQAAGAGVRRKMDEAAIKAITGEPDPLREIARLNRTDAIYAGVSDLKDATVERGLSCEADAGVNNGTGDIRQLVKSLCDRRIFPGGKGWDSATVGDLIYHLERAAPSVCPLVHAIFRANDWLTNSLKLRAFYDMLGTGQLRQDCLSSQVPDVAPDAHVGAAPAADDPEAVRGGPKP